MRIPHGDVSRCIYFKAVDVTDLVTPETGLTGITCSYSIDGGDDVAVTTPTCTQIDATAMPGIYALDIDEAGMVTLPIGAFEVEVAVHLYHASMAPVDRVYTVVSAPLAGSVDDSSPSSTEFDTMLPSTENDAYNGAYCKFVSGDLTGQVRKITDYVASGHTLTTEAFSKAPANTDKFIIVNQ